MTSPRRASLLVVLAHPDDEIFHGGILAHLSERGVRVTLVCATNGEAGKPHPSIGAVDDLGALRVEELRLSCARLGIEEPVLLGFHDSARKDRQRHDDPRALANVDMLDVEAAIRGVIHESDAARDRDVRSAWRLLPSRPPGDTARHDGRVLLERCHGRGGAGTAVLCGRSTRRCFRSSPRRAADEASPTASTPTCSGRPAA